MPTRTVNETPVHSSYVGEWIKGRPTWAEIDLAALRRNLAWVRKRAAGRRVIAVVKADAYGHGAVCVARTLVAAGCEVLAVATLEEAAELRQAGVEAPLLGLESVHTREEAEWALELDLVPAIGTLEALELLAELGARVGTRLPIQLKVDTGMTRLGLAQAELAGFLHRLRSAPAVELQGVMSHLAEADAVDSRFFAEQRARFAEVLAQVRQAGWDPPWIHLDNSAGLVHGPTAGTTAVRVGLLLYGADPTLEGGYALDPVMSLHTRVIHAKDVPPGTRVGYGGSFTASRKTRILTLPIGYADGLPWLAAGRFAVGLCGARVPLAGRVSMDLTTVDAGVDSDASVGEEVLVFGRRSELEIRVEELASAVGTISYEILVGIGARVPRIIRNP